MLFASARGEKSVTRMAHGEKRDGEFYKRDDLSWEEIFIRIQELRKFFWKFYWRLGKSMYVL